MDVLRKDMKWAKTKTDLLILQGSLAEYIFPFLSRELYSLEAAGVVINELTEKYEMLIFTVRPASSKPSICSNAILASSERLYLPENQRVGLTTPNDRPRTE
jgi:hypothetical protein